MKVNKLLFSLLMGLLISTTAYAQESPSKQINQIKRDNSYLYAEATMENADEALDVARELLMRQVLEYVDTNRKLSQSKDVLVKNVNANSASLSMKRGTMFRIFVYVKKTDIEGVKNATALNTTDGTSKVIVEQTTPSVSAPDPVKVVEKAEKTPITKTEEKVTEKQPIVNAEKPIEEIQPAPKADGQPVSKVEEPVMEPQTSIAETKEESVEKVEVEMPAWQAQAIKDLIGCSDMASAKAMLNRMKAEYKIKKYGTPNNCPNPDKAYWIIFGDNGAVNTVLGPGSAERVNFRDMQQSTLDDYKGMEALWFNIAK